MNNKKKQFKRNLLPLVKKKKEKNDSAIEDYELVKIIQNSPENSSEAIDARNKLIDKYYGYILGVVKDFPNVHPQNVEDITNEFFVHMTKNLFNKYNPSFGLSFKSFLVMNVKYKCPVFNYKLKEKLSGCTYTLAWNINNAHKNLINEGFISPSGKEISTWIYENNQYRVSAKSVEKIKMAQKSTNLDKPVSLNSEDEETLYSCIPNKQNTADESIQSIDDKDLRKLVFNAVMSLPEKNRDAIFMYYFEQKDSRVIAKQTNVTHQAISERIIRGRKLLKKKLQNANINEFLTF